MGSERITPLVATLAGLLALAILGPGWTHARAARALIGFQAPEERAPIEPEPIAVRGSNGAARAARVYRPLRRNRPPGVVLVHGVHPKGIDEPRMVALAQALAHEGYAVLTPDLEALRHFELDAGERRTIASAAATLASDLDRPSVAVIAISFAGAIALRAAAEDETGVIGAVLTIGAADDLHRVAGYYLGDTARGADGRPFERRAHPYGPGVLGYVLADALFAPEEAEIAREALQLHFASRHDDARALAEPLADDAEALEEALARAEIDAALRERMERAMQERGEVLAEASAVDHVDGIDAPVFVLHGADDTIIPPTEASFLFRRLPERSRGGLLVTKALRHAENSAESTPEEQLEVVHLLASALQLAE